MLRTLLCIAAALAIGLTPVAADTIAQWDMESGTPSGGSALSPFAAFPTPSLGTGTASYNGPTPPSTTEPAGPVGQSWYFSGFSSALAWSLSPFYNVTGVIGVTNPAPKTAWAQFLTSTSGWQDITISFAQRWTSTSPNTAVLQYTTDGTNWVDFETYSATASNTWYPQSFNLSGIADVNNNPNFGFRIAADVDPFSGIYQGPTGGSVATGGNWRLDAVTVTGNVYGAIGPMATIGEPDKTTTIVGPVSFPVTFDEPVTGFNSSSDVVVDTGGTSAWVGTVTVTGTDGTAGPYTVTLSDMFGPGTVQISVAAGAANAVSGGAACRASAPSTVVNLISSPLASISSPSTYFTNTGPVNYTVTFNVPVNGFDSASDITVNATGTAAAGAVQVSGTDGTTGPYTVTLSNITGSGSLGITVVAGAAQGEGVGNLESFPSSTFTAVKSPNAAAQWTFNSVPADGLVTTGTTVSTTGTGTASQDPLGTFSFATGFPNSGPDNDNSGWNTVPLAGIPSGATDPPISPTNPLPKTRYVQFAADTTSFRDIVLSFNIRFSDTAVNTFALQYTTDGTNWVDFASYTAAAGSQWYSLVYDFSAIAAANNNPAFAVRIAADVDPAAADYKAARSTYTVAVGGTWRFDNVTISGVFEGVSSTLISDIRNKSNGDAVILSGKVLYLKGNGFGYVEEADRSSGIRVQGSIAPAADSLVNFAGIVRTTPGGEKYIELTSISGAGAGAVRPLVSNNRNLRSALVTGLYVKAAGVVMTGSLTDTSFIISDGSDGTGIGVVTSGIPAVSEGDFVIVSGAAGLDGSRIIYQK